MPFWLSLLLLPISAAGIIISALFIKKKAVKIVGISLFSVIFALMLVYVILVIIMAFRYDDPYDDPDPNASFVAAVDNMTDNEDGTYTYDDGEISVTFEQVSPDEMEESIADAASALKGESGGHEWVAVTDENGVPETVFVTAGDTTVSAKVNSAPNDAGAEYTAAAAAVLVKDKKPYAKDKSEAKYRTDSSSFYIEEANCLLYYPAQLTVFSETDNGYRFRDEKSGAALNVKLEKNVYTSMAEVEGFIKNSEKNLVLAYGPNWFTSEIQEKGSINFGYSGFGSKYIVEAEFVYPKEDSDVYGELRKLIKCCFVGNGIWKSSASNEGYSKDKTTSYNDKFSRELAAYYSEKHGVILLYPEIFSKVEKTDEFVFFTDPVTGAEIVLYSDPECIPLGEWAEAYGYDESYIDGERRVKASDMSGGRYGVMYLTDTENVCALLTYPEEYAWVYEEFEQDFTITPSASEIRNIEMQTVFIEDYGALITMPLQFTETSFYDGIIRYKDGLNGMKMTVSFDYLKSDKERKNIFACFDVIADDDNIFVGDSYVRWLSNSGFFYGARGSDMKALMQIDAPNAERAYESTLPMFCVEFVTAASKEETKAQQLAQEAAKLDVTVSDPPEGTTTAAVNLPNKKLIYEPESDYKYASADGEYWYSFANDFREQYGEFALEPDNFAYDKHKELIVHILDILRYNNYDVDQLAWEYCKGRGYSSYYEPAMLNELTVDVEIAMDSAYNVKNPKDSDLGKGIPSVLEEICRILEIEKPDYVRDLPEDTAQVTEQTEVATESVSEQTTTQASASSSAAIDEYRINAGDTSHDSKYGYNTQMAETIDHILSEYDENDIGAYISNVYGDETLVSISEEMSYGKYDEDYGYTTTLVYILSQYENDPVINAMANGTKLPAKENYIYFASYDDYGTGWGEPDMISKPVWSISDRSSLDNFDLLTDIDFCGDLYDVYGDIQLNITSSSTRDSNVPFWINGWEKNPEKAAYCRDLIVSSAIDIIDEYCNDNDFIMDCLSADAEPVSYSGGHTGIKITAYSMTAYYDLPEFETMELYLDIDSGKICRLTSDKKTTEIGSIFG